MVWQVVVPPDEEPISLEEAKVFLRVDSDYEGDDDLIESLITAARQHVELTCNRALVTQEWSGVFASFPSTGLCLPSPLQSVDDVEIYVNGAATVFSAYRLRSQEPALMMPSSGSWPDVDDRIDAITVEITVGYGDAGDVPKPIKTAMLMMIGQWYNTREAVIVGTIVAEVPMSVNALLFPYRDGRVM